MGSYVEDPIQGYKIMFTDYKIGIMSCVIICSILFFNLNGITLTKHVSCVFRAFWDATRTVTVWFFSVLIGLETLELKSSSIQLVGFIFLILGNFTYNEIIKWKCLGKNTYESEDYVNQKKTDPKTDYESLNINSKTDDEQINAKED